MSAQQLYRMTYASHAAFKAFPVEGGIDGNIAQILHTARIANQKQGLVGALYYGNGCFFQCLEGTKAAIDTLLAKLQQDTRHKNLKVLSYDAINSTGFSSWKMKYATVDAEVRGFLRDNRISKFDPFQFDGQMIANLVGILQKADEAVDAQRLEKAMLLSPTSSKSSLYAQIAMFFAALIGLVAMVYAV